MGKNMGTLESQEIGKKKETLHLIYGLLRNKENKNVKKSIVFRQIIRNYDRDLEILKARMNAIEGIWRIQKTVNARDVKKAYVELKVAIAKEEKNFMDRIDTFWKTCLMQPHCKAERKFMLDVDTKEELQLEILNKILEKNKVEILEKVETPNGFHYMTNVFDTRLLSEIVMEKKQKKPTKQRFLEIKHDSLIFVELYDTRT